MAFPTGWGRKVAITVNGSVSGTHTDFPVLLTEDQLGVANGPLAEAQNGGGDLRFSSDSAGSNQLACHVIEFDTTGLTAIVWVKVPSLAASTVIYAWWDTAGTESQPAASALFGSQAVWSDYEAVWIGDSLDPATATGGTLTSTSGSNSLSSTSKLGAGSFDTVVNEGYENPVGNISFTTSDAITLSAWVERTAALSGSNFNNGYLSWEDVSGGDGIVGSAYSGSSGSISGNPFAATSGSNTTTENGTRSFDLNTPHNIFWTWDQSGGVLSAYTAGALDLTKSSYPDTSAGDQIRIGLGFSNGMAARIELVKAYIGLRSADWIATEYANQNDPATFSTSGTPEDAAGGGAVTGTMAAQEAGSDTFTGSGTVAAPAVTGTLAAQEAGSDAFSAAGTVEGAAVTGTMAVQEAGNDNFAASGFIDVTGTMSAQESGADVASIIGSIPQVRLNTARVARGLVRRRIGRR